MSLLAIKQNEPAAEAAGIDTWRWKMLALDAERARSPRCAGGLYAVVLLVVTPESVFGMLVSAQALILALFGGVGSLWGPVIGAVVLVPLAEGLQRRARRRAARASRAWSTGSRSSPSSCSRRRASTGGCSTGSRKRAAAGSARLGRPRRPACGAPRAPAPLGRRSLLVLRGIGISFGGLRALDGIDLAVPRRRALRHHRPERRRQDDAVQRHQRLSRARPRHASALPARRSPGCGRTRCAAAASAAPSRWCAPFPRMTVLENVIVGAFVGAPRRRDGRADGAGRARPGRAQRDRAGAIAGGLTTRELRLMELARALVPHPRLMLLDETLAGLGHDDLDGILGVIRQVARRRHHRR